MKELILVDVNVESLLTMIENGYQNSRKGHPKNGAPGVPGPPQVHGGAHQASPSCSLCCFSSWFPAEKWLTKESARLFNTLSKKRLPSPAEYQESSGVTFCVISWSRIGIWRLKILVVYHQCLRGQVLSTGAGPARLALCSYRSAGGEPIRI